MHVQNTVFYTYNECSWSKDGSVLQLDGPCDFYGIADSNQPHTNYSSACDLTSYAMPITGEWAAVQKPWSGGPTLSAPSGQALNTSFVDCIGAERGREIAAQKTEDFNGMMSDGEGALYSMIPLFLLGAAYMGYALRKPSNVEWRGWNVETKICYTLSAVVWAGAGIGLAAGASIVHDKSRNAYAWALPLGAVCGALFGIALVGFKQGRKPHDNNLGMQGLNAA